MIKLKRILREKGLRHYFVAKQIKVTPTVLSNWIVERTPIPSKNLFALAIYLQVKPDEILMRENNDE